MANYQGTYSDAHGREVITVSNDGENLRTVVRGVEFLGSDFDNLVPVAGSSAQQLDSFTLNRGDLCACLLTLEIPLPVLIHGSAVDGSLHMELELGAPASNGGIDREILRLALTYSNVRIVSSGRNGSFEDELVDIERQLPEGVHIKACFGCLYSDYSPYGHGLFGDMLCFRNLKAEYLRVRSKTEFWEIHGREDRLVQETYLCPEFAVRVPGTGYRG